MKRILFALLAALFLFACSLSLAEEGTETEEITGEPAARSAVLATATDLCAHEHTHLDYYFDAPVYSPLNAEEHSVTGRATVQEICDDCGAVLMTEVERDAKTAFPHVFRRDRCVLCGYEGAEKNNRSAPELPAELVLLLPADEDLPNQFFCTLTGQDLEEAAADTLVLRPEGCEAAIAVQTERLREEMDRTGGTLTAEIESPGEGDVTASVRVYTADGEESAPEAEDLSLRFYNDYDGEYISAEDVEEIKYFDSVIGIKCCRRSVDDVHADPEGNVYVMTRIYDDEMFMDVCRDNDIDPGEVSEQPIYLQVLNSENMPLDEAMIFTDDGEGIRIPILASVTVDPYTEDALSGKDSLTIIMNEAAGRELFGEYGYNTMYVITSDKNDALEAIKSYLEAIEVNLYYSDLKDKKSEILLQAKGVTYSFIYVAICVGFMAVVNILCNVSINISMRLREYGIMRAMGMDRKNIVKLIVIEVVSVTGVAVLTGVILSVPLTCYLMDIAGKVNKLNVTLVAVATGAAIYALNYLICYLKGNHEFSKNIVMLTRQE